MMSFLIFFAGVVVGVFIGVVLTSMLSMLRERNNPCVILSEKLSDTHSPRAHEGLQEKEEVA
jgi:hypothetical protein